MPQYFSTSPDHTFSGVLAAADPGAFHHLSVVNDRIRRISTPERMPPLYLYGRPLQGQPHMACELTKPTLR